MIYEIIITMIFYLSSKAATELIEPTESSSKRVATMIIEYDEKKIAPWIFFARFLAQLLINILSQITFCKKWIIVFTFVASETQCV